MRAAHWTSSLGKMYPYQVGPASVQTQPSYDVDFQFPTCICQGANLQDIPWGRWAVSQGFLTFLHADCKVSSSLSRLKCFGVCISLGNCANVTVCDARDFMFLIGPRHRVSSAAESHVSDISKGEPDLEHRLFQTSQVTKNLKGLPQKNTLHPGVYMTNKA